MNKINPTVIATLAFTDATTLQKIALEPPFWWSGMRNTELQIMVHGAAIAGYVPHIQTPGISIKEIVTTDNPNYLFIYVDLADAKPGNFDITFTKGEEKFKYPYELRARKENAAEVEGFDASDVVYLIMPDRFANGDPSLDNIQMKQPYRVDRNDMTLRHGGDLLGIENQLDYLEDLGVTALWLTPVQENDMQGGSYHGYSITNHYKIDPRFGSNEGYRRLVDKAHSKGIRVIMDMIFNHCGSDHKWLTDLPANDWFNNLDHYVETNHNKVFAFDPYASDVDTKGMTEGWFVPSLPDLNQRNPHLADYLIQNSIWWIEYAGLDGIRQDTYPYADNNMMNDWCKAIDKEYPNFNIVGEIWLTNSAGTAAWQKGNVLGTELKSVMDFQLQDIAPAVFSNENGLGQIHEHLSYDYLYSDIYNVMRFYENHDTIRLFPEEIGPGDLEKFKLAYTVLLTIPGIPQLFYGAEFLFSGNTYKDFAYVRPDVPGGWPDDKDNYFKKSGLSDMQDQAWNFLQKVLQWRKGNEVISKGTMKHFKLQNGVYVYERKLDNAQILVLLNSSNNTVLLSLEHYKEVLTNITLGKDVITGNRIALDNEIELSPKEVLILELQ